LPDPSSHEPSEKQREVSVAAWHDEDDERVEIDLRASARLRKLRQTPDEGLVSGGELSNRLRARYEATVSLKSGASWAAIPRKAAGKKKASGGSKKSWVVDKSDNNFGGGEGEEDEEEDGEKEGEGEVEEEEVEGAEDLNSLLASTRSLTQASRALPPTTLAITRLKDANLVEPSRSPIRALAWHPRPGVGVICVGSADARLRFFRCDGASNSRVASVHLPDLPVTSAGWTGDGLEVIATGRRPFYYCYDVGAGAASRVGKMRGREERSFESAVVSPAAYTSDTALIAFLGNDGVTILASARTKQWVSNLHTAGGSVRAATFSRGPTGGGGGAGALEFPEFLSVGSHGVVSRWCLRTHKCLGRYRDEGSNGSTAITAHPSGTRFAVGSGMGVVNEYDMRDVEEEGVLGSMPKGGVGDLSHLFSAGVILNPKPRRTYLHLTTAIDHLSYGGGPGGDILAFSSHRTRDALRCAHASSGTVFSNWPTQRTPLSILTAGLAFSPGGGYLATGNDKGRALLYRLHHYKEA